MKHKGSTFPYKSERDAELMRAFRREMLERSHTTVKEVFRRVADSPCSRLWITEERAAEIIKAMMGGRFFGISRFKNEMYAELFSRFKRMKEENPYLPFSKLVFFAVNSPAPKFYLSPDQVRLIVTRIRFSKSRPR